MNATQHGMKRIPSVEHLHGLGNSLYRSGKAEEAIESFDSALLMVKSEGTRWDSEAAICPASINHKLLYTSINSYSVTLNHAPDSFFEGECDVGPRPIHSPLHIEYSLLPTPNLSIVMAVLLYNKGVVQHSSGIYEAAADTFGQALAALTKNWSRDLIGSDVVFSCLSHIRALTHNNLGHIRYIEGDDLNAVFHFEAALQLSRYVVHVDDEREWALTKATFASNFARTKWMTGDVSKMDLLCVFREVLRLRSSWLPVDHPDVVCSHLNLGFYLYASGDKNESKVQIKEYLKYATLADSILDPIPAISYLLLIEHDEKDDHLSIEVVRTVRSLLEAREELGAFNAEVASILNYIGTLLFQGRQLEEAMIFYKHELEIEDKLARTSDGISVSVTYNNIGRILQELGRLDEAIGCYKRALTTNSSVDLSDPELGKQTLSGTSIAFASNVHDSILNLYSTICYNLGLIYDRMGSRREAIVAFDMSLQMRQCLFGCDHPDVACLWYNLGTLQIECDELDAAYTSLKEALRIRSIGRFQEDPKKICATLARLAHLQGGKGLLEEAIATHSEILQLQSASIDSDTIAATLFRISELHYARGNNLMALQSAQQSLGIALSSEDLMSSQFHGEVLQNVETVANTMFLIGSLQHEIGDSDAACHILREAHGLVSSARRRLGGFAAAQLDALLEALELIGRPSCAPAS
jgi:tetratricopeptide (TPR) repeat protein